VSAKVKAMASPCGPTKASTIRIRHTANPSIGFRATGRRFALISLEKVVATA